MNKTRNGQKGSKGLNSALAALDKRYGEVVLMKMSDDPKTNIGFFSSGRPDLDIILGGGYAEGKIVEIFSEEALGKTGLALEAIASMQELGGRVAYIDSEHAMDREYAVQLGVDIDELYLSQPSYGEQTFEIIRALLSSGEVDLIVVDSVTAMVPKAELEGESGEQKMALQARMMSQGMKLIAGPASEANCTIIFLNQLRDTLSSYGKAKKPTGGNALKFAAFQRLEIKSKGQIKEGEENVIGFKQFIKVVKNKLGPPFKTIENDIIYGKGVDDITGLIDAFINKGLLVKAGAWYRHEGTNVAKGIKNLRTMLGDNPELLEKMKSELN